MHYPKTVLATLIIGFTLGAAAHAQDAKFDFTPKQTANGRVSGASGNPGNNTTSNQPDTVVEEVIEYEYPSIPVELDAIDKELLLYPDEKMGLESRERMMLLDMYEREQLRAIRSALERIERKDSIEDAYGNISEIPPEEITNLRHYERNITRAKNTPLEDVEQIISSHEVNLSSNKPIDVYLSSGNQASLVFYDRGGNPWPIEGDPHYDQSAFSITTTHTKNHVALFTLKRPFAESNAVINLQGLDMPLVIRLIGNERKVHSRLSLRLPTFGPGMKAQPSVYTMVDNASPDMMRVLNGDSLEGALEYDIEGISDADAYYKDGKLYIRTKALLLVPPPKETSTLPTGFHSYVIQAKRDLLFSVDGKYVEAHVKPRESLDLGPRESAFEPQN